MQRDRERGGGGEEGGGGGRRGRDEVGVRERKPDDSNQPHPMISRMRICAKSGKF